MIGAAQRDDAALEVELQGDVVYRYKTMAFYCSQENGPHYNDVATIFLTSRENAVLQVTALPAAGLPVERSQSTADRAVLAFS